MIRKKKQDSKQVIDLTGSEGNAFVLMGHAQSYAKQLQWKEDQIKEMIEDMMSGDYEHLLGIFDKHFGTFVILER